MKIEPILVCPTDEVYARKESERCQEQGNTIEQQGVEPYILRMPAGVSWPLYLTFSAVSLATFLAEGQVVHLYYRPNLVRLFCCVYFVVHDYKR